MQERLNKIKEQNELILRICESANNPSLFMGAKEEVNEILWLIDQLESANKRAEDAEEKLRKYENEEAKKGGEE